MKNWLLLKNFTGKNGIRCNDIYFMKNWLLLTNFTGRNGLDAMTFISIEISKQI